MPPNHAPCPAKPLLMRPVLLNRSKGSAKWKDDLRMLQAQLLDADEIENDQVSKHENPACLGDKAFHQRDAVNDGVVAICPLLFKNLLETQHVNQHDCQLPLYFQRNLFLTAGSSTSFLDLASFMMEDEMMRNTQSARSKLVRNPETLLSPLQHISMDGFSSQSTCDAFVSIMMQLATSLSISKLPQLPFSVDGAGAFGSKIHCDTILSKHTNSFPSAVELPSLQIYPQSSQHEDDDEEYDEVLWQAVDRAVEHINAAKTQNLGKIPCVRPVVNTFHTQMHPISALQKFHLESYPPSDKFPSNLDKQSLISQPAHTKGSLLSVDNIYQQQSFCFQPNILDEVQVTDMHNVAETTQGHAEWLDCYANCSEYFPALKLIPTHEVSLNPIHPSSMMDNVVVLPSCHDSFDNGFCDEDCGSGEVIITDYSPDPFKVESYHDIIGSSQATSETDKSNRNIFHADDHHPIQGLVLAFPMDKENTTSEVPTECDRVSIHDEEDMSQRAIMEWDVAQSPIVGEPDFSENSEEPIKGSNIPPWIFGLGPRHIERNDVISETIPLRSLRLIQVRTSRITTLCMLFYGNK